MKRKALKPRDNIPLASVTEAVHVPAVPFVPPPPPPLRLIPPPPPPPVYVAPKPLESAQFRKVVTFAEPVVAQLQSSYDYQDSRIMPNITFAGNLTSPLFIPTYEPIPEISVGTLNADVVNGGTGTFGILSASQINGSFLNIGAGEFTDLIVTGDTSLRTDLVVGRDVGIQRNLTIVGQAIGNNALFLNLSVGSTGSGALPESGIVFNTARAANLLQAIDDVGPTGPRTDLYFDGNLLARSDDIQNIADWSQYPATESVNWDTNGITNLSTLGFVGGDSLSATGGVASLNGTAIASQWSSYPASTGPVELNSQTLNEVGQINMINPGTLAFGSGDSLFSEDGVLKINDVPVASNWSSYPASTGPVGLGYQNIINCTSLGLAFTGPTGTNGLLTTDAGATGLYWNGQLITSGTGGDVSQWSTFVSVNNTILPNSAIPTIPLTIGTRSYGASIDLETRQNLDVNAANAILLNAGVDDLSGESHYQMSTLAHDILLDRGTSIVGPATISINAKNGTYGNIQIVADPSSDAGVAAGGLVNIQANSASGVTPLALSRVNAEAATLTLSAGALGGLAYVPGSVNLLSGAGSGVQILTGTGVINIASGVAATLSGGAGVYLNGASSGVNVAGGNLYVSNGNSVNTDLIVPFSNGPTGTIYMGQLALSSPSGSVAIGKTGTYPNQTITLEAVGGGVTGPTGPAGPTGATGTFAATQPAYIYYVSKNGSDTASGSSLSPFATIARAMTAAGTISDTIPVGIQIQPGSYTENVLFSRSNVYITGVSSVAQETIINGSVTFNITSSTAGLILGGLSNCQLVNLICTGTPTQTTEYTIINCVILSPTGVIPFAGFQGGAVSYNVIFDGVTFSPTDTRAAGVTSIGCTFLRCLMSALTANVCLLVDGSGYVNVFNCQISSSLSSATNAALVSFQNSVTPSTSSVISQSRLFYTSPTTDTSGAKCCIRFQNTATISCQVDNCYFNCVGAATGSPLIQCIQKTGAGAVNLQYGNIQAVSPAVWIAPAVTRTILSSVQQGVNAVGGGAGDYLRWDGNQWITGTTSVSLGRSSGNTSDTTCVSIGNSAGTSINTNGVAIGNAAGQTTAANTIGIGTSSGANAGAASVHIGQLAGSVGGAFANTIVLNATGVAVNPTAASTCQIAPIRANTTAATFTAANNLLSYNPTTSEVVYTATAYKASVITAPGTLALNATLFDNTYIVTGTGTLTITNTLAAGDSGFSVMLKNGNNTSTDITLAGVAGATTLHGAGVITNGQVVILFWNGTTLTAY
jgi:hypothetical protein